MNSEVSLNNDFSENSEKSKNKEKFIKKINFSWIRILICILAFIGLVICRYFYTPYYIKISTLYSENFKNNDEKISEMKNFVEDKLKIWRLEIKDKINNL